MSAQGKWANVQAAIGTEPDGIPGSKDAAALDSLRADAIAEYRSKKAVAATDNQARPAVAPETGSGMVDARSEANIATLHPRVQPLARALVHAALAQGIAIKVTSGTRTYAEQNDLYEQGRSKPGKIVTNARGGYSNHNFGVAFDVTVFVGASPKWDGPEYRIVGALGKALGLDWGGDWSSIQDEPHFELRPDWAKGDSETFLLAGLRTRHDAGRDAFA